MIKTHKFERRPFFVDAVQVTTENMSAVADWCHGEVRVEPSENNETVAFVKVMVHMPRTDRQTKAYVGDWVLYAGAAGKGFKVYSSRAFEKSFVVATEDEYPVAPPMRADAHLG